MAPSLAAQNSLMWIPPRPDLVFVAGQGSWLTDGIITSIAGKKK